MIGIPDISQLPLLGVILCCTSIPPEQRSELAAVAEQMGAVHKFDLTSDVTHLVVGETDTPKYKFVARERSDVKVVLPSWIETVRASWLEGGATDVEALELAHKLPTYHGLRVCVTGFEDPVYRKQLEDQIQQAGGTYLGNLTKDVTHLIVKKPGSDKYEYARKHREIKAVSIEWHEQSLDRGMVLEEALYNPLLPAEERGRGAWTRRVPSTMSLGKRAREHDGGSQNARKLRRTASAKFESHNDNLWTDIVGAEVKVENARVDDWDESAQADEDKQAESGQLDNGDAKIRTVKAEGKSKALQRSKSLGSLESRLHQPAQREPLFQDKKFLLRGFDEKKTAVLARHLHSHGASLVSDPAELSPQNSYLLIPHTISKSDARCSVDSVSQPQIVTDFWIERCMHLKACVEPSENIGDAPFEQFPIAGFEKLNVSSTGFQGIDLLHASKVVNLMGGTYYEYFTEKSTVLVCKNVATGHEKLRHAQLWNVPAVKADWLWDCIDKAQLLPFNDYLVQPSSVPPDTAKRSVEAVPTLTRNIKPTKNDFSTEKSLRPPPTLKEQFKHPKREPVKPKSSASPRGNSFPDDAGPLLDDAGPLLDDVPGRGVYKNFVPPNPDPNPKSSSINHKTSRPSPLHEKTPNSSPPKLNAVEPQLTKSSTSPVKENPKTTNENNDDDNDPLGPVISSLLSHHQNQRSSTTAPPITSNHPSNPSSPTICRRRHRRPLLGRAPSNLSTHSHSHSHSIPPSRASSIDTLNTDGLGTPLEPNHSHSSTNNLPLIKSPLKPHHQTTTKPIYDIPYDDPDRPHDEHLQMTQLGYEDPDVAAWRERVAYKMGGGKVKAGTTPGRKAAAKEQGVKDGGLGISKRTRMATGGAR